MSNAARAPAERGIDRRFFVLAYATVLGLGAVAMLEWITAAHHWVPLLDLPWWLFIAAFFVVEATALHIEIRRESHTLSLTGVPLLIGVLSLSPAVLLITRLIGSGLTLTVVRRRSGVKLLWNLCLFALETTVILAIASFALVDGSIDTSGEWLIMLAALLTGELVSLVAVPLVIMVAEGELRLPLFAQLGRTQLITLAASSFGVVMAAATVAVPALAAVGMVPIVAVGILLRIHGRLGKEHHDLQQMHGFAKAISGRDSLDTGLRELCQILRLRGSAVVVKGDDGHCVARVYCDDTFRDVTLNQVDTSVVTSTGLTLVNPGSREPLAHLVRLLGGTRGMGSSIADASADVAYLLAFDRLGASPEIGEEELRLFQSMASTLGARLSADRLLEQLETQAKIDTLTGLANRRTLEHTLDERLGRPDRPGAVLLLDLDRFKDVNDSLGHEFGDQLLKTIASRLTEELRSADTVARLGGDEFAVILDSVPDTDTHTDALDRRLDHLAARLGRPLDLDGVTIEVTVSIGMAQWPTDAATSSDLLRLADIAMYEAKRTHQRWVRYEPTIDHTTPDRIALMGQLREAIHAGQLEIHLQPQHRATDLRLVGAEALVRWNHPTLGLIPPGEFIPLAEHSSLAGDLTRAVLHAALTASDRLAAEGIDVPISVNLTSRDLLDRQLPQAVADALQTTGTPAHRIAFEVTESSLIIDLKAAITTLSALQELGCRTSADDFGTGYASLQYLQQLPLDEVKIDQSFIIGCLDNPNDQAIVRSTTHLIHELGLEVVAEGVEDVATRDLVRGLGCDVLQGYLFSRPVPVDAFVDYCASPFDPTG